MSENLLVNIHRTTINWTNLPDDILNLIAEKLIESERVSMKISCKIWYDCVHNKFSNKHKEVLPWAMYHGNCIIKLFDPTAQISYTLKSTPPLLKHGWGRSDYTMCRFSKNGWVLFYNSRSGSIFFYSPFSNEVIELPSHDKEEYACCATFSSIPTSPDCITVFHNRAKLPRLDPLQIQICKIGDKSWKKFPLKGVGIGETSIQRMVYCRNWIYCWLFNGTVHGFDVKNEEWKLILDLPKEGSDFPLDNLFVGSNGDVMLLHRLQKLWRLDESKKEWISVCGEEEMIFDNLTHLLSVPASGNAKGFGGVVQLGCQNPKPIPYPKSLLRPGGRNRIWIQHPFQTNFNRST